MSNRVKGLLVGIACSLVPAVIWVLLAAFAEIFVGWIGALMGILFILPYKKLCPEDKSKFPYIVGALVLLAEVVIAEIIAIAIIAADLGFTFGEVMELDGMVAAMLGDIFIGLLLSYVAFFFYVYYATKKAKQTDTAIQDNVQNNQAPQGSENNVYDTNYFVPDDKPMTDDNSGDNYNEPKPDDNPFGESDPN